ncbi:class I SAM-dependent methyltransferase [Paenibacillus sp. GYB004]|uniref:class I SAM-dependent methyltransferase n=1 Tax=Paenibacillus sp. GYB004 TaxID=2994393 RepID=UPI002F96C812
MFKPGSWLHKPVRAVMETMALVTSSDGPKTVLNLGCGVGRNSIPIASRLQGRGGKVVCVDILQSALDKLHEYGEQYGVRSSLDTRLLDIGDLAQKRAP